MRVHVFKYPLLIALLVFFNFKGNAQTGPLTIAEVSIKSCLGSILISVGGGLPPYTYVWKKDDGTGNFVEIPSETAREIKNQDPGFYRVIVTDANNVTVIADYVLSEPVVLFVSEILTGLACAEDPNSGVIILSFSNGFPPYTWTLTSSSGVVTVGTSNDSFVLINSVALGDYTFDWKDSGGCVGTEVITVTTPATTNLIVNSVTDALCFGASNGSANISVSGGWGANYAVSVVPDGGTPPSLVSWTDIGDGTSHTITGLAAGIYQIYYYDKLALPPFTTLYGLDIESFSCKKSVTLTIKEPVELLTNISGERLSCFGDTDGNITGTISGGTAPYTITLDQGVSQITVNTDGGTFDFSGLIVGSYNFSIVDALGCNTTAQASITQPDELITSFTTATNIVCNGDNTGSITINVTGGTPTYVFDINGSNVISTSNSGNSYTFGNLGAGNYTITITDQNNCTATNTIIQPLTEPTAIIVNTIGEALSCFGDTDGNITGKISGGAPPYTITLVGGSPIIVNTDGGAFDFSGLSAGNYTFSIVDASGCTTTAQNSITQPAAIPISAIKQDISCFGLTDGILTVPNHSTDYTYVLIQVATGTAVTTSSVQGTNLIYTDLSAGDYRIIISGAGNNGGTCTVFLTETINEPLEITGSGTLSLFNSGSGIPINISCNGANDGSIDLSISGGTGSYTYNWSTIDGNIPIGTENNQDLNGLVAGTYTVQVSDQNSCQKIFNFTLNEPRTFSNTASVTQNNTCFSGETGSVTSQITNNGSNGSVDGIIYTYTIIGSPSLPLNFPNQQLTTDLAATFTNLPAGDYQVQVVDQNGCTSISSSVHVDEPASSVAVSSTISDFNGFGVSCNGDSDGSISITANGGTPFGTAPFYKVVWTGPNRFGSTLENITNLEPGTYDLRVTDANGCVLNEQFIITEPLALTLFGTTSNFNGFGVSGNGANDGSIDITVSGGTNGYTFGWSTLDGAIPVGQETNQNITGLTAGTYTVIVTDQNGCTITDSWIITEPLELLVVEQLASHVNVLCFGDATGVIDAIITQESVSPYDYIITDSLGAIVEQVDNLIATNYVFDLLPAGTYTVTVVDANGNIATITNIDITQPAAALATNATVSEFNGFRISCFGANDASIGLALSGGTPLYQVMWTGPNGFTSASENITNLEPGTYDLTVTDANGCVLNEQFVITEPLALTLSGSTSNFNGFGVSGNGAIDGSINTTISGGTGIYTYAWTTLDGTIPAGQETNQNLTNLTSGTYTVVVIDQNGCTTTDFWTITQPLELLIIEQLASHVDVLCFGDAMGTIEVNVTQGSIPPYDYIITDDLGTVVEQVDNLTATGYIFNFLQGGTYTITVVDANGNIATLTNIIVTQPVAPITTNATVSEFNGFQISCFSANDASISLDLSGGTPFGTVPFYQVAWTGPNGFVSPSENITNLEPGTYDLSVTDANGCVLSEQFIIAEPLEVSINIDSVNSVSCNGAANANIQITAIGGTGNYTFEWTQNGLPFATTKDISNLTPGEYQVTVTDTNSCFKIEAFTITEPSPLVLTIDSFENLLCFGDDTAFINVTVNGGTPTEVSLGVFDYQFSWIGPNGFTSSSSDISNLIAGTYTLMVTDALGCQVSDNIILTQPDQISIAFIKTDISCYQGSDGSIQLSINGGGVAPFTYTWSDLGNGTTRNNLAAGIYTVTVTDAIGCSNTEQIEIIEAPLFEIDSTITNISCFGENDGSIDLNILGGEAPLIVTWQDDASAGLVRNNLIAGIYTVLIEEAGGCAINQSFTINEPALLLLDSSITNATVCDEPNSGAIDLQVTGGSPPFTFQWSNGATTEDLQDIGANDYTVTVIDSQGCQRQATFVVTRQAPIELSLLTSVTVSCENKTVIQRNELIIAGGVAPYSINWSNGTVSGTNGEIMHTGQNSTVIVKVTDSLGCTKELTFDVNLLTLGDPDFDFTSISLTQFGNLSIFDPIQFNNRSTGDSISFFWEFGDGTTSQDKNPIHSFSEVGTVTVRLTVYYPHGCAYSYTLTLNILQGYNLIIPTAFTPNGDGINDTIKPVFFGMESVKMSIFDTWGSLIYQEEGLNLIGWDGTVPGNFVENGNYLIIVKATSFNGVKIDKNGPVTLIK